MKSLFSEFNAVSASEWEARIMKDLRISSTETLLKTNPDGIRLHPFYTSDDMTGDFPGKSLPGEYPYLRGSRKPGVPWKVQEEIIVHHSEDAAQQAEKAVLSGADIISFVFPERVEKCPDVIHLFDKVDPAETAIVMEDSIHPYVMWSSFQQNIQKRGVNPENIRGGISFDPLGFLTRHGVYPSTEEDVIEWEKDIHEESMQVLPFIRTLHVNGSVFHDAGGTPVQEIAFSLAMGKEYLDIFTDAGISAQSLLPKLGFGFAVGPGFFSEIAKLRAFRLLWSWISEAYFPDKKNLKTYIHSRTALWNMTIYDPHVNILRATTETMSAILGGADSITARGFDAAYKQRGGFSTRIARNIQLILKYESYFDKTADPAAGSYYIETLTKKMADKAWSLFLEVEKEGGYRKALKKGMIQKHIEKAFRERQEKMSKASEVLIGTNRYPLRGEKFPEKADAVLYGTTELFREKNIVPLKMSRAAEPFETLRLTTENAVRTPRVLMFGTGHPAVRTARETFASNFFAIAGFDILDGMIFTTPEEGVLKINEVKPDIVVVCDGDDNILPVIEKIAGQISVPAILVVAGDYNDLKRDLEDLGVKYYIHDKSNILKTLTSIQNDLGIR